MTISDWLRLATRQLKDIGITSSRLDAELILANTLRKSRTFLHANLEDELEPRREDIADARLELRLERVPIAYILGFKEFYGREFKVSPATLVPRPESEDMIALLLEQTSNEIESKSLIDIGTGSGILGITAKLERPELQVTLIDISEKALEIATENATSLGAEVKIRRQDLLYGQVGKIDYILANLPYVDREWTVSAELQHEPAIALFAENHGLALIFDLLVQTPSFLSPKGLIFIEADPEQHQSIIDFGKQLGLELRKRRNYIVALRLISA